jgi:hypothetical protein
LVSAIRPVPVLVRTPPAPWAPPRIAAFTTTSSAAAKSGTTKLCVAFDSDSAPLIVTGVGPLTYTLPLSVRMPLPVSRPTPTSVRSLTVALRLARSIVAPSSRRLGALICPSN